VAQLDGPMSHGVLWEGTYITWLPVAPAVALSAALGVLYAATLFSPSFVMGTSDFWNAPAGIVGGSTFDMETTLSGYTYFVRDEWRFPLLNVPQLGAPEGSNAAMLDVVPWVALLGKALFRVFGLYLNPYGAWSALMFAGNGLAMTFLLRAVGLRSLLATLAGTGFGLLIPALHYRFGHLAMSAQWLIVAALAAYFYRARGAGFRGELAEWAIYVLALLTNIYLAAMCAALFLASTIAAAARGELSPASAAQRIGILIAGSLAILVLLGIAGSSLPNTAGGFGSYSMNLVSLFWPGDFYAGPQWQYEGYAYLGAGSLLLLFAAFARTGAALFAYARRHWPLLAALTLCAAFALSNEIYAGSWHVAHVPLPDTLVNNIFAHFRSSGRFIWPLMYFLTFAGIALTLRSYPAKKAAVFIALALLLQSISVFPLHRALAEAAAARPPKPADKELTGLLTASNSVEIYPSYQCSRPETSPAAIARRVGLQMLAAPELKPINSVYAARSNRDCATERPPESLSPGTLYVFLDEYAAASLSRYPAAACRAGPQETICAVPPSGQVASENAPHDER
jgi:uncharacterized membrane protein